VADQTPQTVRRSVRCAGSSGAECAWNIDDSIKVARSSLGEGYQKRKPGVQS